MSRNFHCARSREEHAVSRRTEVAITPVSALLWGKPDRDRLAAVDCKHGGVHSYRAVPNTPLLLACETETPRKWRPKRSST